MSEVAYWDQRYRAGNSQWVLARPSRELMRTIEEDRVAAGAAIDLGCGLGTHAAWLAEQGFDVTGVDISPVVVEQAREHTTVAGVSMRYLAADLCSEADVGGPYDFFFDRGCYHHVRSGPGLDRYLATLWRITRPGSVGLVLTGNANHPARRTLVIGSGMKISLTGPPVVSEAEIRRELGSRFEIVRLREFRFDEGDREDGWIGWSCLLRR
jgi:SAM-dependent methyltransferase